MTNPSEEEQFLTALGRALHDWQLVEMALAKLLASVIRSPDDRVASEMFYAVQNFRDKVAMVDAAVCLTFWRNAAVLPEWVKLRDALGKKSKRRNRIAHSHTWEPDEDEGYRLGPHYTLSEVRKAEESPQSAYLTVSQLASAAESFLRLSARIGAFDQRVRELLTPRR